jgi:uncharacterized membrane protein YhiD involved in acid resistance
MQRELRDDLEPRAARVIQGLATGVGFLGAGAIMKMKDEHAIRGIRPRRASG